MTDLPFEHVTRDMNGIRQVVPVSEERALELVTAKALGVLKRTPNGQLACKEGYLRHARR